MIERQKQYKVVQLSSAHGSTDTRIFYKICGSLVKAGYDVDLIIQHERDEIVNGIRIKALPIAQKKSDRIFKVMPVLLKKCIKYPPNTVFHFHDPELIPVGFFLKAVGYRVVYDVHEDVPKDILSKEWLPSKMRSILSRIIDWVEQKAKNYFDATIVVTEAIQKRLESTHTVLVQNFPIIEKNPGQITVIEEEGSSKNKVFYLGDITLIRGLREDVQAINYTNHKADLEFILGGKFSPPGLKKLLEKEEGWQYVNFAGWINKEDFSSYASQCFAGLVTFHPEPNHIEAQPNKLFEYMYAGLPVVASDFPLWRDIVEGNECGLLVDSLDPEEIGEAILWLYNNPDEATKMGKNGRSAVIKKYNWRAEEEKLLELYASLV
jgi:glycosyltransferase involved in cell wall biosynthesis